MEGIKGAGNAVSELYEYQGEGHAFMNKDPDSIERMKSAPLAPGRQTDPYIALSQACQSALSNGCSKECAQVRITLGTRVPCIVLCGKPVLVELELGLREMGFSLLLVAASRHDRLRLCCAAAGIPVGKAEDQQKAWSRVFEFLKQHLG